MPCLTRPLEQGRAIIDVLVYPSESYLKAKNILVPPAPYIAKALLDTGATITAIDEIIPTTLALQSKGPAQIGGVSGGNTHQQYDVDMIISLDGYTFTKRDKLVVDCKIKETFGVDILLGMDIIQMGSLTISQAVSFTFCL